MSRTCSACLDGFTANKLNTALSRCSAGSLLARFFPPRDGLHARGFAGSARRTASRDPSRWASTCGRQTTSGSPISTRLSFAPRSCACISGASACQVLVGSRHARVFVASELDLVNMFGNSEWLRICEALRTHFLAPLSPQEPYSPPTGEPSRVTCCTIQSPHVGESLSNPIEDKGVCDDWFCR